MMNKSMKKSLCRLTAVSTCVLALSGVHSASALDILLTNDDGWDAPGIQAVFSGLTTAGHNVTMVAPCDNQSGSSARFHTETDDSVSLTEQAADQWCVDGSPVDAMTAGLDVVLAGQNVDLVVSGANFGQNVGRVTNHSGTVGATISAARNAKLPAIAVSVGVNATVFLGEELDPLKTILAFPNAAQLVVDVIAELEGNRFDDLLPEDMAININFPAIGADMPNGVALTRIDDASVILPGWEDNGDGTISQSFQINIGVITKVLFQNNPDLASEGESWLGGYATISPMLGSWGVKDKRYKCDVEKRLKRLEFMGLSPADIKSDNRCVRRRHHRHDDD